jgi:hypothetical protein
MDKLIINTETNEETLVEFTVQEIKEQEKNQIMYLKKIQTQEAEAEAKETAKAALLTRLGITQEEAQLLLGGN